MSEQIPVQNITPPPAKSGANTDLYASREKIYTRAFTGIFRNLRMAGGALLFLLYFGTVWLSWNDRQAVWWNLPSASSTFSAPPSGPRTSSCCRGS
ncbi:hypothetical protein PSm6_58860 [Pseudomonas solani]|uniref:Uncharacterized protein n=1 Tax=Pseudomonas solani TaxID=2731552 RepID=A0ABN6C3J0_9PSED|nr:hypothetical protein PSm6_58860 [Pseudomonas solani]